jgi:hypothetical protein
MQFKYTPQTLKKIEGLIDEMGFIVRYEKGTFNSGYCILEDRNIAVINKFLSVESRINVMLEIIPTLQIDENILSSDGLVFYKEIMKNPIENN